MKTKVNKFSVWSLVGAALMMGFVACGKKDDSPKEEEGPRITGITGPVASTTGFQANTNLNVTVTDGSDTITFPNINANYSTPVYQEQVRGTKLYSLDTICEDQACYGAIFLVQSRQAVYGYQVNNGFNSWGSNNNSNSSNLPPLHSRAYLFRRDSAGRLSLIRKVNVIVNDVRDAIPYVMTN